MRRQKTMIRAGSGAVLGCSRAAQKKCDRRHRTTAPRGETRLDIFSRKSGPRTEDVQARQHLQRNWGTIEKLADTLSGGKYSADKARRAAPPPQPEGLIIVDQAARRVADDPDPYLRISANGRVVVADAHSGVQLHFLGQLKRIDGALRFAIASAENGFISPLQPELQVLINDLEGQVINRDYPEEKLAEEIKTRLGFK
jgi:hypothetical protein